ncbi:hypothetical protein HPB49_017176 [Dermacentor silvarum]|uniref:Uncharacterized protein n=1 Tax=Dermacentor silvarum TaxID=543639 RepID=A0ACB8CGH2_DERSI|nr:hypothetical protein HPB49_017176 [Dermacentor silvarum]
MLVLDSRPTTSAGAGVEPSQGSPAIPEVKLNPDVPSIEPRPTTSAGATESLTRGPPDLPETVGFPRSVPVLSWLFSAGRSKNLRREAHGKCTAVAFHRKLPTLVQARPHRFLRRRASPSPGAVPFLLLDPSPTGSALRANPFPKVTDPFCRLPLPTLVYRLEAVHLGDLLRMWVRSGTEITLPHSDFQGPTGAHRTAQEPHCSTEPPSLSRGEPIPGTRSPYRQNKTLPGAPIGVSELVCVRVSNEWRQCLRRSLITDGVTELRNVSNSADRAPE